MPSWKYSKMAFSMQLSIDGTAVMTCYRRCQHVVAGSSRLLLTPVMLYSRTADPGNNKELFIAALRGVVCPSRTVSASRGNYLVADVLGHSGCSETEQDGWCCLREVLIHTSFSKLRNWTRTPRAWLTFERGLWLQGSADTRGQNHLDMCSTHDLAVHDVSLLELQVLLNRP